MVSLIYGNVTFFGKKVWQYALNLFKDRKEVVAFGTVETRIKEVAPHGTAWWRQRCETWIEVLCQSGTQHGS